LIADDGKEWLMIVIMTISSSLPVGVLSPNRWKRTISPLIPYKGRTRFFLNDWLILSLSHGVLPCVTSDTRGRSSWASGGGSDHDGILYLFLSVFLLLLLLLRSRRATKRDGSLWNERRTSFPPTLPLVPSSSVLYTDPIMKMVKFISSFFFAAVVVRPTRMSPSHSLESSGPSKNIFYFFTSWIRSLRFCPSRHPRRGGINNCSDWEIKNPVLLLSLRWEIITDEIVDTAREKKR
jgi:hypothetical protein